jgi:2-polyprenyl-6-methoxyphenol hydroxylase-like FAD-dependent oxidoreductase
MYSPNGYWESEMGKTSRVLISGAGVAGLACGQWLGQSGMQPVIVEKAKDIRAGGYLVSLSDQAYRFAEQLGLLPDLRNIELGITASSYHDRSGRAILDLDYGKLFRSLDVIQMMRDDFVKVQHDRVRDLAEVRFGDSIAQIEHVANGADVTFASGVQEHYDVVIGADGLYSSVRAAVFDADHITQHYLGLYCAAFRLPNVLGISRKFETHMEKDRYMAVFTTRDGDLGAVFVWAGEGRERPERSVRGALLQNAFKGASATTCKVLEHCPTNNSFYLDALCQVEMPTWHQGNSVLVGDAAHSLTLFSGRGAGAAFAGASRLSKALIEHDVQTAFAQYEAQTRPIISMIQPATRNAVKWYVPRSWTNYILRDTIMRFTPNVVFRKYFRMKYSQV